MKKNKKAKKKAVVASKAAPVKAKDKESIQAKPVKKRRAAKKANLKERASNLVDTVSQFLREVRVELSKVTWPTRKDTIASTSVVLVIVILIAAFLGIVDLGLSKIMRFVLS